ncbi:DUF3344 domain-containing protein [Methanosarcina siciliae]|nr:DUF3344 domain-containing protein [Methanosarcina siciliae]
MLCIPASANYSYEGYPLETVDNGTGIVLGEVYVSCGDNAGLQGTSYQSNTFVTNFSDVPTDGIVWAELKVGVWGGKATREGFANATLSKLDDSSPQALGTVNLNTANPSSNVDCCGNGVYLIKYDCKDELLSLSNSDIKATINAWPNDSLASTYWLDSRIYGAVLIVVYENGNCYTQYWINQGNLNLHKNVTSGGTYYPDLDANITWFNGTVNNSVGGNATLTVGYFAGDDDQNDYLYFNPPKVAASPYNLSNFNWPIVSYTDYQLDCNNVANETCDELNFATKNFDLHTFDIDLENIELDPSSNYAVFWRGHGNGTAGETEINDPSWPGVNPNTESYLSPFLAVLQIKE